MNSSLFVSAIFLAVICVHCSSPPKLPRLKQYVPLFHLPVKFREIGGNTIIQFTLVENGRTHLVRLEEIPVAKRIILPNVLLPVPSGYGQFNVSVKTYPLSRTTFGYGIGYLPVNEFFIGKILISTYCNGDHIVTKFGENIWLFEGVQMELFEDPAWRASKGIFYKLNDIQEFNLMPLEEEDPVSLQQLFRDQNDADLDANLDFESNKFKAKVCSIDFVVDFSLWNLYFNGNDTRTERLFSDMIHRHLANLNLFFWTQQFGLVEELAFRINNIKFLKDDSMMRDLRYTDRDSMNDTFVRFELTKPGRKSCITVLYVYKIDNTRGIAKPAGICHNRGQKKTQNTALLNFYWEGEIIEEKTLNYILRHEVSHLLGAVHDSAATCGTTKKYLMCEGVVYGEAREKLSAVSIRAIADNLEHILSLPKGLVLKRKDYANCLGQFSYEF